MTQTTSIMIIYEAVDEKKYITNNQLILLSWNVLFLKII